MSTLSRILPLSCLLLICAYDSARAENEIILQLSRSIAAAASEQEKSRLHIYRARNYTHIGEVEKAEEDYDAALQYDHKGWIHLERAKFYLAQGDSAQARKEAIAAEKETPTLKSQCDTILSHAEKTQKVQQQGEDPKVILLTRRWNVSYTKAPPRSANESVRRQYAARNKASTRTASPSASQKKSAKRGRS